MLTKNACLLNHFFSHSVDAFYSSEKKTRRQYRMVKSVVCLYGMCLLVCADTLIGQIPKGTTEKKRETKNLGYLHSTPHRCISPQILLQTKSTHLFSLHFSQVALLFQHQTNVAQIITPVGWNKGEQSYMFQNASFVVLLNNVLTTNYVFSAQARGKEPSDYQQLRRDEDTRGQFSSRFFLGFSLKWCFALVVS